MDLKIYSQIYRYAARMYGKAPDTNRQENTVSVRNKNVDLVDIKPSLKGQEYISVTTLDALNFNNHFIREDYQGILSLNGVNFTREQIPDIPLTRCKEVKAKDNKLVFENGEYYQFKGKDGMTHLLACESNLLCSPYSDRIRGYYDSESFRLGQFWHQLSRNTVVPTIFYTQDEIRNYITSAGITEGFYSLVVGDDKQELFYSGESNRIIIKKDHYDANYESMTQTGIYFKGHYLPGDTFIIDKKEYVLSEDYTIDLPYGVDIYDVVAPKSIYGRG